MRQQKQPKFTLPNCSFIGVSRELQPTLSSARLPTLGAVATEVLSVSAPCRDYYEAVGSNVQSHSDEARDSQQGLGCC